MAIGTYMICLDREILKGYTIKANWSRGFHFFTEKQAIVTYI